MVKNLFRISKMAIQDLFLNDSFLLGFEFNIHRISVGLLPEIMIQEFLRGLAILLTNH